MLHQQHTNSKYNMLTVDRCNMKVKRSVLPILASTTANKYLLLGSNYISRGYSDCGGNTVIHTRSVPKLLQQWPASLGHSTDSRRCLQVDYVTKNILQIQARDSQDTGYA